jgi:hypothetical protein
MVQTRAKTKPSRAARQVTSSARRKARPAPAIKAPVAAGARRCRAKFLRHFPKGFHDETYVDWERGYKWDAHVRWEATLDAASFRGLLAAGDYGAIAARAVAIEARTNLLFSFEKMALRDAVKSPVGARAFAHGLYQFLHGEGDPNVRFAAWCEVVAGLPRRQTRVLTWPVITVFGFIAQPKTHFFLKPMVTRRAAEAYGLPFAYRSRPNSETYSGLLALARAVKKDLQDLQPRDMIDIQSFLWVQGSDENPH